MKLNLRSVKENLGKIAILAFIFLLPMISFAGEVSGDPCGSPTSGQICNPIKVNSINQFVKVLLEGIIKIGIPIVALAIIYSGFLFVQAQGNPEQITKAKQALLYSVIGAVLLLGSWAIAQLISETVLQLG